MKGSFATRVSGSADLYKVCIILFAFIIFLLVCQIPFSSFVINFT